MKQTKIDLTLPGLSLAEAQKVLDALGGDTPAVVEPPAQKTETTATPVTFNPPPIVDRQSPLEGHEQNLSGNQPPAIDDPETGHVSVDDTDEPPATTPPATAAPQAEKDARGLDWDERIHSSAKSKLVNGNWKNRRGIDAAVVAQVEAELFGRNGAQETPAAITTPPAQETPAAVTTPAPITTPPQAAAGADFPALMNFYIQQQAAGKITPAEANSIAVAIGQETATEGVTALAFLAGHPNLVPLALQRMEALCATK